MQDKTSDKMKVIRDKILADYKEKMNQDMPPDEVQTLDYDIANEIEDIKNNHNGPASRTLKIRMFKKNFFDQMKKKLNKFIEEELL